MHVSFEHFFLLSKFVNDKKGQKGDQCLKFQCDIIEV